jgi:hypothetical protein
MIAVSPLAADTVKRVRCVLARDGETVTSNVPPLLRSDQHVAELVRPKAELSSPVCGPGDTAQAS